MHTPETDAPRPGLGAAARQVAEHASALARLELELAGIELKQKVAALAVGIGLAVGAAVFGVFALGFLLATAAAGLATFLSTWLALLIVSLALLVVAGILALLAKGRISRGTPPVPKQAIAEAKETTAALRGNGGR